MMSEAHSLNITVQNERYLSALYQISLQGDAVGLQRLIREDALVLDMVSVVTLYGETPLHIAAMRGHFDFARVLLQHKPQLALDLDSIGRVPLHWACEKGYTHIVKELLPKSPDACFWRDKDGKIPLHLAVIERRNDVVLELVRTQPESIREKVENGGTVLHLCVRYNCLDALKLLVNTPQGHELVNASDDHGNTILDLAFVFKRVEIMGYLLSESNDTSENASNKNGYTTSEAAEYSDRGKCSNARKCKRWWNKYMTNVEFGLQQARGSILVAATVTASMDFQASINPPRFHKQTPELQAKESYVYPIITNVLPLDRFHPRHGFWLFNTKSLFYSLAIIMFMQSGIPVRTKLLNLLLVFLMCSVVMSTLLAYYYAAKEANFVQDYLQLYIEVFAVMFYVIIGLHVCTFVMSLASKVFNVSKC